MSTAPSTATSLEILGPRRAGDEVVLSPDALGFVAELAREFAPRIEALLAARRERQARFDAGERPDFLPETAAVRADGWTVAPLPHDLQDRRVEITGPVERKMIINALNSGARVFMADFEDSSTPTWENVVQGQVNLRDATRGVIRHVAPDTGKVYEVGPQPAVLMVRPRGLHLPERHLRLNGQPVPGCLVDFGLFFFHNVRALLAKGSGPYFYLPKLQSHREARLWNDVFLRAQEALSLPRGTIKATVLIETLPAAFEMDEILFELREHSAGLNCGRWDYIFSFIKTLRRDPTRVLPDRSQLTMDKGFLSAYVQLLIRTCHRRNVHAMGGMAAYIPVKDDPEANATALAKVRADKLREVQNGHDGTWVAHPGLVALAAEVFDQHMPGSNQIQRKREDVKVTREELLAVPEGTRTEAGLRHGLRVGLQYLESWLRGTGCVPIYNLMEDAATAEICRTQVWQWIHHRASLDDGSPVTVERFRKLAAEELAGLRVELGPERFEHGRFDEAAPLFDQLGTSDEFTEFLTLPAYERVLTLEQPRRVRVAGGADMSAAIRPIIHPAGPVRDAPAHTDERFALPPRDEAFERERWKGVTLPYAPEDVERLRGSLRIQHTLAERGARRLWHLLKTEPYVHALGAITGNQAVQMARAGLKSIYLSGWQVAADGNSAAQTYPDQSLYPADSVPNMVRRINRALQRADQIERAEGETSRDWFLPIVADAEAGFGGPLNAFELMKAMIEAGAAAVHYEDQVASEKKCGHMGGKVLVPTSQFIRTLIAARLAADVLDVPTVLIARTDADSAKLLLSDADPKDEPFIDRARERTAEGFFHLKGGVECAVARGIAYAPYADVLWCETSTPDLEDARRFAEGVHKEFPGKLLAYNCSPSFNWKRRLDDATIAKFQSELGAMGYKYQFVTLAGFHAINYSMFELALGYRENGMTAYTHLQQDEFAAERDGYTATKHQHEVGTAYFDRVMQVIASGHASTLAMEESTETQQFT